MARKPPQLLPSAARRKQKKKRSKSKKRSTRDPATAVRARAALAIGLRARLNQLAVDIARKALLDHRARRVKDRTPGSLYTAVGLAHAHTSKRWNEVAMVLLRQNAGAAGQYFRMLRSVALLSNSGSAARLLASDLHMDASTELVRHAIAGLNRMVTRGAAPKKTRQKSKKKKNNKKKKSVARKKSR